jgi:hypothetical protein
MENAPAIISAVDDVLEQGTRSSTVTAKAIDTLDEAMRMAREHSIVRDRLRFLLTVVAERTHVSGALAGRLEQLKADAAALVR